MQTDELPSQVSNGPAAHTKCVGSADKVVGCFVSNLGPIYPMLGNIF